MSGSNILFLVWEIVTGLEPHEDEDQLLIGARIRDEGYHPQIPNECDPALQRVMEMCWQKDPNARPVSLLKSLLMPSKRYLYRIHGRY